jgi:peptidoglycan/xylan/chitin deacetylase (PgdA/CDA1 family)
LRTRDVVALCYHAISPTWKASLSITPTSLDAQIRHMLDHGWAPSTFTDAVLGTEPGRVMAITFDDAFASVKELASPILERYGVVGTVFAPTAFMSGQTDLDWDGVDHWKHTEHANEMRAMDWDDLRGLVANGWEVGSHTITHPHLTTLDDAGLRDELVRSREACTEHIGVACRSVAYPYGDTDGRVMRAAAGAGYATGACLSSRLRVIGPLGFPRTGVYQVDDLPRFRLKLAAPIRSWRARR